MESHVRNVNNTLNIASTEAYAPTEVALSVEEEDAIVTLVVVVIGIIIAIIVLFSMGIFIDCKHQKKDSMKRRRLKLKMPPLAGRGRKDDAKAFASDMCPNGVNDTGFRERDEIV